MNALAPRPRRIMLAFGTRPEAIKMAPILRRMREAPGLRPVVCVTAQHRDLLDRVLALFGIEPDHDLALARTGTDLSELTAALISGLGRVLAEARPDRVVVQGDTATAFAAALAAFHARIPVAHVEAGLRSGNLDHPWPEELYRKLTAGIADLHFAPTEAARAHLLREGVDPARIHVTGGTGIDALLDTVALLRAEPAHPLLAGALPPLDPARRLLLVTGHRRENQAGGLERVALALRALADRGDVDVVYPVHPSPAVRRAAALLEGHARIHLLPPLDYLPFVALMRRAHLIVTDSGGVQEEAPCLGKPVLITRETTERPEPVAFGTAELVGTATERLVERATHLLDDPAAHAAMSRPHSPYGDGRAAERILGAIADA